MRACSSPKASACGSEKRWAEWLTVIITASLIPIEIYEIWRQPTAARIVVLLINLAIVGYLLYRIRAQRSNPK